MMDREGLVIWPVSGYGHEGSRNQWIVGASQIRYVLGIGDLYQ